MRREEIGEGTAMTTNGGAREALERSLTRIDAESERLNAFITLAPDEARAAADVADKAAAEGRWLGLLHGMPMAVKRIASPRVNVSPI